MGEGGIFGSGAEEPRVSERTRHESKDSVASTLFDASNAFAKAANTQPLRLDPGDMPQAGSKAPDRPVTPRINPNASSLEGGIFSEWASVSVSQRPVTPRGLDPTRNVSSLAGGVFGASTDENKPPVEVLSLPIVKAAKGRDFNASSIPGGIFGS